MTTNPSYEYAEAQKKFHLSQTDEQRLVALEEMLRTMPQHKSAEAMRANIRTRYKKLKASLEKSKKSGKSTKESIKKEAMQATIVGFPNSGKSSVFNSLTNVNNTISPYPFSTTSPEVGTLKYEGCNIQIIDMPAFPNHDLGIINNTDTLILVIENFDQIKQAEPFIQNSPAKKLILFNKIDLSDEQQKRKLEATASSKKYNVLFFSSLTNENLGELKKELFRTFPIIRIYLKEPKKPISEIPMILKQNSTLKDVAEKILKGFSKKVKKARIWGPSSKFSGQSVGLNHALKDKDVVEFQTS